MSTSLLYHAFGVRGYQYVRTEYEAGHTLFTIRQPPEHWRCPACGSRDVIGRGVVERRLRTIPIGGRRVSLVLPGHALRYPACDLVPPVELRFPGPCLDC